MSVTNYLFSGSRMVGIPSFWLNKYCAFQLMAFQGLFPVFVSKTVTAIGMIENETAT
ncbi:hypothetical protein [Photobacterium damselae]|uniref:hypothetical protein n=1 Tax=Photobacterium damselae TaxID=38293 RepID=UPI001EDF9565|nr:hypothetical protein [Photobacterium damselae]MCG3846041.1 hypothetical protein [Photobacterium damselae]